MLSIVLSDPLIIPVILIWINQLVMIKKLLKKTLMLDKKLKLRSTFLE